MLFLGTASEPGTIFELAVDVGLLGKNKKVFQTFEKLFSAKKKFLFYSVPGPHFRRNRYPNHLGHIP